MGNQAIRIRVTSTRIVISRVGVVSRGQAYGLVVDIPYFEAQESVSKVRENGQVTKAKVINVCIIFNFNKGLLNGKH